MLQFRETKRLSFGQGLRENRLLLVIFAAALALRLFVLFTEGDRMFLGTDDDNYRQSAEILLKTGVLTYAGWKEPTTFIMPGYPLVLAALFAVVGSSSWLAARLLQVAVSLAALWFAVKLGVRLGGRWTGIITGVILAVYPPNLTTPCFLLTEAIFTCMLLAALYTFSVAEETGRVKWFALTGLALAISTYFRPTTGMLPVVFGVYLLFRGYNLKKALYNMVIVGVVLVLGLSPWIIRNYINYREFIPFTASDGNPFLRGTYIDGKIDEKFPWVKGERALSDRAQMEYGKKRFVEGFRKNFRAYLYWYTVGKFKSYWSGAYYYKELSYLPGAAVQAFHRFILWTGAGGFILGLWRRKPLAWLFLMVCGYFTAVHLVYLTAPRYSYPVIQLIAVMSAHFAAEVFKMLFRRVAS